MNPANAHQNGMTPQARLDISRRAIVRHMHDDDDPTQNRESMGSDFSRMPPRETNETWAAIKRALRSWWHHHPASTALELAEPVVSRYAQEKPFRLLAIAAGAGVAIAVIKPWRLIPIGGVLLAAMKSSDISGTIFSILSPSSNDFSTTRKTR